MECAIKAGRCRRFSQGVNMMARKNPVKAARSPSVIERLWQVRGPGPPEGTLHTPWLPSTKLYDFSWALTSRLNSQYSGFWQNAACLEGSE